MSEEDISILSDPSSSSASMPQITGDKPSNAKSDDATIGSDMELKNEESIIGATLSFQAFSTGENNELEDSAPIQESNATEALKAIKHVKSKLKQYKLG